MSLTLEPQHILLSLLLLKDTDACVLFILATVQPVGMIEEETLSVAICSNPCKLGNCFACLKHSVALSTENLQRVCDDDAVLPSHS